MRLYRTESKTITISKIQTHIHNQKQLIGRTYFCFVYSVPVCCSVNSTSPLYSNKRRNFFPALSVQIQFMRAKANKCSNGQHINMCPGSIITQPENTNRCANASAYTLRIFLFERRLCRFQEPCDDYSWVWKLSKSKDWFSFFRIVHYNEWIENACVKYS